jgi:hypothetical protein
MRRARFLAVLFAEVVMVGADEAAVVLENADDVGVAAVPGRHRELGGRVEVAGDDAGALGEVGAVDVDLAENGAGVGGGSLGPDSVEVER